MSKKLHFRRTVSKDEPRYKCAHVYVLISDVRDMKANLIHLFLGALGFGPQCKSIGKGSCNNLVVTSSPMMVQRLGPISPPASQVSTACKQISPSLPRALNAANLNRPPSDSRSQLTFFSPPFSFWYNPYPTSVVPFSS